MNRQRYNRLVNIFNDGLYKVSKELDVISMPKHNRTKEIILKYKLTKQNRLRYRLTYKGKRYEYEGHEIISVWYRKCVVDMICLFKDGNPWNIEPSNLYWTNKKGGKRIDLVGKNTKISYEEYEYIKNFDMTRDKRKRPKEMLAKKFNISFHTVSNIRGNKHYRIKRYCETKNNRV